MSDTPETDAAIAGTTQYIYKFPSSIKPQTGVCSDTPLEALCRKLEREKIKYKDDIAHLQENLLATNVELNQSKIMLEIAAEQCKKIKK
mgnify:CR=1 FL=1